MGWNTLKAFTSRRRLAEENAELRKLVARQGAMLEEKFKNIELVDMRAGLSAPKGGLSIELMKGPIPYIAEYLFQMMRIGGESPDPANYMEAGLTFRHRSGEAYVVTTQRVYGKTPHQIASEAINRAEVAERALERLIAEREARPLSPTQPAGGET